MRRSYAACMIRELRVSSRIFRDIEFSDLRIRATVVYSPFAAIDDELPEAKIQDGQP